MYYRRKILLALVGAFGNEGVEETRLRTLLFLFCRQQEKPSFHFFPCRNEHLSLQADRDLSVLTRHYRLLDHGTNRWTRRRDAPVFTLEPQDQKLLDRLLRRFRSFSNSRLVKYVESKCPSIGSRKTGARLFTIGYEGKSIDFYLNELIERKISLLCDIRKNPVSMKYGFSKRQLQKFCEKVEIAYEHISEFGIESAKRQSLNNPEDYKTLFAEYDKQLPQKKKIFKQVAALLRRHKCIALTCFEKEPQYCHRHLVSNYLQQHEGVICEHL